MNVDDLLQRLEKVSKKGNQRWTACCPAHRDKTPSLSIREGEDGQVLLYCFGGCGAIDVLDSLGLSFKDLFPSNQIADGRSPLSGRVPLMDMIPFLDRELLTCVLVMNDVLKTRAVTDEQWHRFAKAAARIGKARDYLRPAQVKGRSNGPT